MSCIHHKQLTLQPEGERPIVAVLAECDRSGQEVTETWVKWTELASLVSKQSREKDKIKKGEYKLKKGMKNPFEVSKLYILTLLLLWIGWLVEWS